QARPGVLLAAHGALGGARQQCTGARSHQPGGGAPISAICREPDTVAAPKSQNGCLLRVNVLRFAMTKDQVKAVLDRVLTWPPRRQEEVAELLMSIEAQDKSDYRLNDAQIAELRRRRAEASPKTLTLTEFDERLRRFGL